MSTFGAGPMWGVGGGGASRGGGFGGGWGGAANATQGGAPFAGIPPELQQAVTDLVATEPDHGQPKAKFTHRAVDTRPLTLRSMIFDRWQIALLSVVFLTIETVGFQTGPYLTQVGIDHGLVGPHHHLYVVVICGLVYLGSVIATVFVERARIRNTGKLAAQVMNDLRIRVFTHIQRLSLDYFTEEKAGVIMTRMTSDIEALQQLLQDGLAQFAIQGLTMVLVTAVLLSYNWKLALVTVLIVMPALAVASLWFRSASERAYLRVRDGLAGVISDVAENLSGVRVVTSYNRQRNNVVHHRNVLGTYREANFSTARVTAAYSTASDFIGLVGQACLLLIGGAMVLHSWHHVPGGGLAPNVHPELTIGELTAFVLYLGSFFQPIQQLVQLYSTYQQGQAAVNKLRMLLATPPSVLEMPEAADLPPIEGAIDLEKVDFAYSPGQNVLEDVSISVRAGESVAFVGQTGAGKSTIAKLVTRFYDPTAGHVRIDGHDLAEVGITSLRRQLGVVPQEPFLFSGTIRDNVAFARPAATDEEVRDAVEAVGLGELVERLPYGLETEVHERGQSLSSGERQLIALARAFLAGPRVLVLDEATSNLDLKSEVKVERALERLLEGRTAILIAHRLTTAMRADRIAVVEAGRVTEVGSHDELLAAGGRYAEMFGTWSRQHDSYDAGEPAQHATALGPPERHPGE
ncbi:MAG TPA: ABC transporter ATP-binding protein [Acidimicrobiales bacterium]|nr:ABC transporter ATP-binding protein [Acidimicrobiales bacterium]